MPCNGFGKFFLLPTSEDIQNVCLVAGAVVLAFADGAR